MKDLKVGAERDVDGTSTPAPLASLQMIGAADADACVDGACVITPQDDHSS